jgi:hypothetical protein
VKSDLIIITRCTKVAVKLISRRKTKCLLRLKCWLVQVVQRLRSSSLLRQLYAVRKVTMRRVKVAQVIIFSLRSVFPLSLFVKLRLIVNTANKSPQIKERIYRLTNRQRNLILIGCSQPGQPQSKMNLFQTANSFNSRQWFRVNCP